jgi:hypothetical protein
MISIVCLDLFRDTAPQDWVQSCLNFGARSQLKERYQNSNPGPSGEDATTNLAMSDQSVPRLKR